MRRGSWHQFGDRSQKLALEQFESGVGVGAIISPRDLPQAKAIEYAQQYRERGADVLFDTQFYVPDAMLGRLPSYDFSAHRNTVSQLAGLSDARLSAFTTSLCDLSSSLGVSGVIAPAVVYEAARPDIDALNARLFEAARQAASKIEVPVYATVVLGRSVAQGRPTSEQALAAATSLDADGWYVAYEFPEARLPVDEEEVLRSCKHLLKLAGTGLPVLHAYAGPLGLLSPGCGVTGVGVGHSQNLWRFCRGRWQEAAGQGGGGDAPPRHFSRTLWGTIIDPDEVAQLSPGLADTLLSESPYRVPWNRWNANKHLVHVVCTTIAELFAELSAKEALAGAQRLLAGAVEAHASIQSEGVELKDETSAYQECWRDVVIRLQSECEADYQWLELVTAGSSP